jgi:hypothetical protein
MAVAARRQVVTSPQGWMILNRERITGRRGLPLPGRMASLTWASSTRSPRSNGCRRTSGPWARQGHPLRASAGAMSVATLLSMPRAARQGALPPQPIRSRRLDGGADWPAARREDGRRGHQGGDRRDFPPSACFRPRRSCGMIFSRVPTRSSGVRSRSATAPGSPA